MQELRDEIYAQLSDLFNLEELSKKELEYLEKHIDSIISNGHKLLNIQNKIIENDEKLTNFSEMLAKTLGKV